jgi:hypothetical protein
MRFRIIINTPHITTLPRFQILKVEQILSLVKITQVKLLAFLKDAFVQFLR